MKKLILLFLFLFVPKVNALNSEYVILYNLNENTVIYEQKSNEEISVASLTKIMTTIVAIENIENLDDKVIIKPRDFIGLHEAEASLAGFEIDQEVTYKDLLYGLFLPSGAEAAYALANNLTGSIDNFVDLMNEKADELNMNNTNFVNPTGLDEVNHYSTVQDISKLLNYALQNDTFKEIYQSKTYTTSDSSLTFYSTFIKSALKYGYDVEFIQGAKTGHTDLAGDCLASTAFDNINNISYMLVTCKADGEVKDALHIKDAVDIYTYYFNNYKYQTLVDTTDLLVSIKTKYGKNKYANFYLDEPILYYLNNDYDKDKVNIIFDGLNEISYKDDYVGKVSIYYDNNLITTKEIYVDDEYKFSIINFLIDTKIIFIIPIILVIFILKKRTKRLI